MPPPLSPPPCVHLWLHLIVAILKYWDMYMIPGGVWEGGGECLALSPPPLKKSLALIPPKKIYEKMWPKNGIFVKFLANRRDFHKSAIKFHEILFPL